MALIDDNRGGLILPRTEGLPDVSKGLKCSCDPWPCTERTCRRDALYQPCAACRRQGRAFYDRRDIGWMETGEGFSEQEVEALVKLSVPDATNKLRTRTSATDREEVA